MARIRYKRRRALGPRQVRAVKSIVRQLPETKIYWDFFDPTRYLFSTVGTYLNARFGRYLIPIHANIPKFKNTATDTNISVIGDEFYSVGVAVKAAALVTGNTNYRVRISIISSSVGPSLGTGPFSITNTNYDWMESQTPFSQPTIQSFSDGVNVLKSKTISMNEDGGVARTMRIYAPIRGKKEAYKHETTVTNSYVGTLTGRNYYIMVEWYSTSTTTTSASDNINLFGEFRVYFKDA